jgi:hypothetical protein
MMMLAMFFHWRPIRAASLGVAILYLSFGLVNQHGILLPELSPDSTRSGHLLERSREYLAELASNQRFCRTLSEKYFESTIVSKYPYTIMLACPELGYVERGFPRIYHIGPTIKHLNVKRAHPRQLDDPNCKLLFAPNVFERDTPLSLIPGPTSQFLVVDEAGGGMVVLHCKKP